MNRRHRQQHHLAIELRADAHRHDHSRPQQGLTRCECLVGEGQLRQERARLGVRFRRDLGDRGREGATFERVSGDGKFLAQEHALDRRCIDRRFADHRVGHTEVDVDGGDVDETERDLVRRFALAGFDVLFGNGRVVKRDDELAVGVVVVRLVELHPRVGQRVLGGLPVHRPR